MRRVTSPSAARRRSQTEGAVRVAFVSSHATLGGSERYLELLLRALGPEWRGVVVALAEGPFVARLEDAGVPVEVIATGTRAGIVRSAARLRRTLRETSPPVVHANGVKAALVAALASVGGGPPIIWVKHDYSRDGWLARPLARRCWRIVGVSSAVTHSFRGKSADRVRVVSPGIPEREVDERRARATLSELAGGEPGDPIVALVGRIGAEKGQLDLVEAAPTIRERLPAARFVLLGSDDAADPGYGRRVRERVRQLGLGDAVALPGHRNDAADLVAGADVVAIPSTRGAHGFGREGFGLVAVEAMAAGTAVVAYADGALPETLGPCARLVAAGETSALADAIADLLSDPATRRGLAECGRRRARERFSITATAAAMKDLYREAGAASRARGLRRG